MSFTAADVAEILRLVEESSFDELSLEYAGLKLNFKRGAAAAAVTGALPVASLPTLQAPANDEAPLPVTAAAADPDSRPVSSPLLGTFYRSPKPGAPPFVTVGSVVTEDTIVAIIEVMKLMNTVRAQARGTVTEILARDGALVEYGETLLRIKTD